MVIRQQQKPATAPKSIHFSLAKHKNALLIFTRNPVLGECKTRLAATVGDQAALDIYTFLLRHTADITKDLYAEKIVYYSQDIWEDDSWDKTLYQKKRQRGKDLGERMHNAFLDTFQQGFERVIIIGSDMYDLQLEDLERAFTALEDHDTVLGPATDGGYYLLGMKKPRPQLFANKKWGTDSVLRETLADLKETSTKLLEARNDVDHYEDIAHNEAFAPFLKHIAK